MDALNSGGLPGGAGGLRADMRRGGAAPDDPGEAEVSELGLEPVAEQDVASLDVTVEHGRASAVVQEREHGRRAGQGSGPAATSASPWSQASRLPRSRSS